MASKEQAVRAAAKTLHEAIVAAREAGLYVQWPKRSDELPQIAISETRHAGVTVAVNTHDGLDPETTAKAAEAAQKAADRVVQKAAEKA